MSNRQARREQARTSRTTRQTRPSGGGQRKPSSSRGGGSDIFSRGFILALGAMVVVAVGVIAAVIIFGDDGDDSSDLAALLEQATTDLPLDMVDGAKIGSPDAPVKIVAYEDFQCPFCLRYTAEQEPEVVAELVKGGKIQLEYRHLPILGNESLSAAMASQCAADQDKFWQYHHLLFLTQARAGNADPGGEDNNSGRFSDDKLKGFASEIGLDRAQFDNCYDTREHLDLVTAHQREANSFGITGTPGFTVNGQALGTGTPQGIEAWRQIVKNVEDANATATAAASGSPSATTSASPSASASPGTTPAVTPTATRAP